jgi:hypothetical protein
MREQPAEKQSPHGYAFLVFALVLSPVWVLLIMGAVRAAFTFKGAFGQFLP